MVVATREQLTHSIERELCDRHFRDYLRHVRIEDSTTLSILPYELWPHLIERADAWENGQSEIILKARQLGLSWLAAAYVGWKARRFGATILLLSMGKEESKELLNKARITMHYLPAHLRPKIARMSTEAIEIEGGGRIIAMPSTIDAGTGYTSTLVVADEAARHPYAAQNYGNYGPTLSAGGQLLIISTANGPVGWYPDMWRKSVAGEVPLTPVFINWQARPGRDMAWYELEKSRYPGMPEKFKENYPLTPEDAFVALGGLVYGMFSPERHFRQSHPVPWEHCLARYGAYDLGGGDPTAASVAGIYRRSDGSLAVHVYDHFHRTTGAPDVDELYAFFAPYQRADSAFAGIVRDPAPGGAVVAASLRSMGLPILDGVRSRAEGISLVAAFLEHDWLTFSSHIGPQFKHEFESYHFIKRTDPTSKETFDTRTPYDHHGDSLDELRLMLTRIYADWWGRTAASGKAHYAYSEVKW